ncbi:hypothetical protein HMA55_10660 [Corynebacterium sp. zg-913]|uniref:Type I restriction modification DNA specificity domain-containing protein n=1 Tax=Corynebacterium wankanglinii TaxID=2735136 RepID=A0A7V8UVW7_9CORY|nr:MULTISPECIES: restriction endonuclease subunit S [Corynebacterium]MBA1838337.1 hypothetical protein [Corynebacterium wankanglinii]
MNKQNWIPTKVKDVAKIVSGATPKTGIEENWGGDIPWLTPKDLSDNPAPYTSHGSRFLTEQGFNSCSTHMLPKGTVLLTSRAPVGYVSVAANDICTNQGFKSLVLEDGQIPEFWYYLLSANTETLLNYSGGSTFKELSKRSLEQIEFLIPPIEEQREIVSFMQALDLMIQAGDREIASAEQMRGDVARTLIRQVGEEFEFKPLQEVVEFHDNKRKPVKKADRVPGSYPYYGASGIADYVDNFLFEGLHLLIAEDGENIRTRKLPIAFLANGKFWVNNHAHIVKAESDTSTQYVALAIEFSDVSAYISGSSRPKITKSACQSIQIPFPPLEDQKKIVGKMQTLDTYIDSAKRSQEALKQVRQDALHALLSGDKGVRDLAELFASDEGVA